MGIFSKFVAKLKGQSTADPLDWKELEAELLAADLGPSLTAEILKSAQDLKGDDAAASLTQILNSHLSKKPRALSAANPVNVVLIVGVNGTGKTTLLNSLLSEVEKSQRILIIEDSRELNPQHPHVVSLEGRPANIEGMGLITLKDLIKQSLRMRADRLIIGEVRGAEVIDWLSALNTGHSGSAGTIHANSIHEPDIPWTYPR